MFKVAKFEKVSLEQWRKDAPEAARSAETLDALELPARSTTGSAGYDARAPFAFELQPGETRRIPLGIRCRIEEGWVLLMMPRSGMGFKYKIRFDNTVGVIDSDYYNADNEGHIMLSITNGGEKQWTVAAGDKIAQGLFVPFGITEDDSVSAERTGGFGSTGR